jgi:16S rRNA (cytosine1402-N4)-methyltransferase
MNFEPLSVYHQPVMLQQVLDGLAVRPGGRYIDCTLGDAGHAAAILDAAEPGGRLLGLDADPEAVAACQDRLGPYGTAAVVIQANFASLESTAQAHGFVPAHGVLFDLGLSSRQLDAEDRGFSFQRAGPLDMRFDPSEEITASELVNRSSERDLADLIYRLGEEPRSRRIAKAIVDRRPITDAQQLAEIVRRASGYRRGRTHPATRTFQALRLAVNRELDNLASALAQVGRVLDHGGRLVTIAYHSLEDRLIKGFLAEAKLLPEDEGVRAVIKRVVRPSQEEVLRNRRSRSARIRVAERP